MKRFALESNTTVIKTLGEVPRNLRFGCEAFLFFFFNYNLADALYNSDDRRLKDTKGEKLRIKAEKRRIKAAKREKKKVENSALSEGFQVNSDSGVFLRCFNYEIFIEKSTWC